MDPVASAWLGLAAVPLLGSLITEPAAMTIAALMLCCAVAGCKRAERETPPAPAAPVVQAPAHTKEDAMASLLALPELQAWSQQIELRSKGKAHGAVIEENPVPREVNGKKYYQLSFVENRADDARRRESFLVAQDGGEILVDDRGQRRRMPGRRHSPDGLSGRRQHLIRRGPTDATAPKPLGESRRVHAVRAAGHDQQRLTVRPEDQAVGDRPHLHAERRRGQGGRGSGIRQHDDVAGDAGGTQGLVNDTASRRQIGGHADTLEEAQWAGCRNAAARRA